MIVTLTPNPSVDATLQLSDTITPGSVHRAEAVLSCAGGKAVNVSRVAYLAGHQTLALFPARPGDRFLRLVEETGIPHKSCPIGSDVRINTTITEPGGRTTKVNGPGPVLSHEEITALRDALVTAAADADWVVLAGSLPSGVPTDWYATLVRELRDAYPQLRIAVDTSDAPMRALAAQLEGAAPDLIKPNGLELGQLTGTDGLALEDAARRGDYSGIVAAARQVANRGVAEVLVTLGDGGACLVTAEHAWVGTAPTVEVVSTVGAGDSTLSAYICARIAGKDLPMCLAEGMSYGTAAVTLPGTELPSPQQAAAVAATVTAF